ncbi:MAG: NAD(P)/FAD-dependent oxidoreductase [Desulfatitalea sp.]|nr:NAD(P)/FAD-dependent oxidoreductase [Desulfatitalea sp.]NNK00258.1 NAD(P)/FAD-dependent oxidoreductase [Desulfatitalea sp.]
MSVMKNGKPGRRIVILGGGYAGMTAATALKGIDATVTLVNRNSYHYLTTLLHQPAVGSRDYRELSVDIRKLLPSPVDFLRGRVEGIDMAEKCVSVRQRGRGIELPYDTLLVCLGSEPRFYKIPGLEENALTLKNLNASRLAKDRLEEALLALDDEPEEIRHFTVIIGGGGLAGVELAGELIDSLDELANGLDFPASNFRIVIIEGGASILAGLDPVIVSRAVDYFSRRGVKLLTGRRIVSVEKRRVLLSDGSAVDAGVIFWTGGVRGSSVMETSGFPVAEGGRMQVNAFLQTDKWPDVFVIGDCGVCRGKDGSVLPPTAWLAVQQGQHVAENIRRHFSGVPMMPFVPKTGTVLLSLGRRHALGKISGRLVSGIGAAILKDALAFRYIFSLGGLPGTAMKLWQWFPYLLHLHRRKG